MKAMPVMPVRMINGKKTSIVTVKQGILNVATDVGSSGVRNAGGRVFNFDPSGNAANSYVSYYDTSNVGMPGINDWAAYALLYDFYKVTKIRLTTRQVTADAETSGFRTELYHRYSYDHNLLGQQILGGYVEDATGVKVHTFTDDCNSFTSTIYPRVLGPVFQNTSTGTVTWGVKPVKMGWVDVDNPIRIMGYFDYLLNTNATNSRFVYDVYYEIKFKNQR